MAFGLHEFALTPFALVGAGEQPLFYWYTLCPNFTQWVGLSDNTNPWELVEPANPGYVPFSVPTDAWELPEPPNPNYQEFEIDDPTIKRC